jgi:hypothetical protein
MHALTKPFATRAAARRYSAQFLPPVRLAVYGLTDADTVLPVSGGWAALFRPAPDGDRDGDVFHGVRGAATRRQIG